MYKCKLMDRSYQRTDTITDTNAAKYYTLATNRLWALKLYPSHRDQEAAARLQS